jgi:hypothetical protein
MRFKRKFAHLVDFEDTFVKLVVSSLLGELFHNDPLHFLAS